jgi:hypothetical protein
MGTPKIIESYSAQGVNLGRIVKRILNNAPKGCLEDLEQVKILDSDPQSKGFACYIKEAREIRLFAEALVGWQPWILKKTFFLPYITVGLALGHEIDHHVNRENNIVNKEQSAENNAIKYIYPSFGVFKPVVKMMMFFKK